MAAGQKVWLVLALFSVVEVDQCRALADPQVAYNTNGIPGFEGTWSWQTPEGSSVWIQYPVNNQGLVPWTPAGFSYSISSDSPSSGISFDERIHSNFLDVNHARSPSNAFRSGRKLDIQIPNNNFESSIFLVNNQNNNQNEIIIEEENIPNAPELLSETSFGPATGEFQVPLIDKFSRPQIESSPVPEIKIFPEPVKDHFSGSVMNKFPGPVMDKFPSLLQVATENPFDFKSVTFKPVPSPTVLPTDADFRNNVNNKFDSFNSVDTNRQVASPTLLPTEANFRNNVNNRFNAFNNIDRNDQVEDSPELGPVVRLSSRGRPIRRRLTTRQPTVVRRRKISAAPRLLQDAPYRQRSGRLSSRGRPQLVK